MDPAEKLRANANRERDISIPALLPWQVHRSAHSRKPCSQPAALTGLRSLKLTNCGIGDSTARALPALPHLHTLSLEHNRITGAEAHELRRDNAGISRPVSQSHW